MISIADAPRRGLTRASQGLLAGTRSISYKWSQSSRENLWRQRDRPGDWRTHLSISWPGWANGHTACSMDAEDSRISSSRFGKIRHLRDEEPEASGIMVPTARARTPA